LHRRRKSQTSDRAHPNPTDQCRSDAVCLGPALSGATVFPGMILWGANAGQGPTAVPGNYQARLTVGNHVETQQFAVKIDPRLVGVTERDLQEQFDLAMKIRQTGRARANQGSDTHSRD